MMFLSAWCRPLRLGARRRSHVCWEKGLGEKTALDLYKWGLGGIGIGAD